MQQRAGAGASRTTSQRSAQTTAAAFTFEEAVAGFGADPEDDDHDAGGVGGLCCASCSRLTWPSRVHSTLILFSPVSTLPVGEWHQACRPLPSLRSDFYDGGVGFGDDGDDDGFAPLADLAMPDMLGGPPAAAAAAAALDADWGGSGGDGFAAGVVDDGLAKACSCGGVRASWCQQARTGSGRREQPLCLPKLRPGRCFLLA